MEFAELSTGCGRIVMAPQFEPQTERRYTVGDKGGKKGKDKSQKQKKSKEQQKEKEKQDKQPKRLP